MCGRFVQVSSPALLGGLFDVDETVRVPEGPDYNITPRREVAVIMQRSDGRRALDRMRWGLVPSWAKEVAIGDRLINARGETVAEKPSFRRAFARRRCIVPADGFYEWMAIPGRRTKQPVYIHGTTGEPLALAGLWESWRDPTVEDALALHTCTIITTDANATLAPVHDRMPVILPDATWDVWLDPASEPEALVPMLRPAAEGVVSFHEVSTAVNTPRHNDASLLEPAPPETLF
ncbi:MAG: SOS response-associated peptidase [Actinomycetes bacterium]